MSEKRILIALLAAVCTIAASAVAQDEKNEVGGMIGRDFISSQTIQNATSSDNLIRYGRGLSFEGSYARRVLVNPLYSFSAEVVAMYDRKEKLHAHDDVVPPDYKALFITPGFRVNFFPMTAVSPWASIGGGFAHISQNKDLIFGGTNPGKTTSTGVLQYGFGLDVRVWRHLSMRGEFRDFWSGEPDFPLAPTSSSRQHNYFIGGGGFWRF